MMFSSICEKALSRCGAGICICWAVCVLCIASFCCAQTTQAPGALPPGSHVHAAANTATSSRKHSAPTRRRRRHALPKKSAPPLLPSDAAAQPAVVSLNNGTLTIQANNSDLSQILRDISKVSGMTIEGFNKSARVFGQYGPGAPSDVLTDLLAGFGYNFVIVGERADGAPRELLLTAKNSNATVPTPSNPPAAAAAAPAVPAAPAASAEPDAPEQPSSEVSGDDSNAPASDDNPPPPDPQISPDGPSGP